MTKQRVIFISARIKKEKTRDYILKANPDKWPLFPLFPVRRDTGQGAFDYELGVVLAFGNRLTVYLGNIFNVKTSTIKNLTAGNMKVKKLSDFFSMSKIEYKTVDDLLDAGWRGD